MERPTQEASENFLFHLYRGTELLGDNRVQEAKEEIERAHALQPHDTKVRDLLAALYFRLGSFDRALALYQALAHELPNEANLQLNLGLTLFRLADFAAAKAAFERVVELEPANRRVQGYLGITHERLGALEEARAAFERGGHDHLVRKIDERVQGRSSPATIEPIDSRAVGLELAEPFERPAAPRMNEEGAKVGGSQRPEAPSDGGSGAPAKVRRSLPPPLGAAVSLEMLANGHTNGSLPTTNTFTLPLREGPPKREFAIRSEAVRALSGAAKTTGLDRRYRTSASVEILGGTAGQMLQFAGDADVIVAARHAHRLLSLQLNDESMFVREDALVAFESSFPFMSGKLARSDDDPVYLVQLRGSGDVLLEVRGGLVGLRVTEQRSISVQLHDLLAWTDRLVPQIVDPGEAPGGQRGLVSFAGTGTVFISGYGA